LIVRRRRGERLVSWLGPRRGEHRHNGLRLYAAPEKQSIQQQQDHCADHRHDPTGDVIFAYKKATDPRAYKRTRDPQEDGDDATTGIFSRHQQLCDGTDNKTNKDDPNN
jgi:hypothetical protein